LIGNPRTLSTPPHGARRTDSASSRRLFVKWWLRSARSEHTPLPRARRDGRRTRDKAGDVVLVVLAAANRDPMGSRAVAIRSAPADPPGIHVRERSARCPAKRS
jgi:hypothetical protein